MRVFILALLGSFLGGCGGGGSASGSASCSTFAACGGDPTGTWNFSAECNAGGNLLFTCSDVTWNIPTHIGGTFTLKADHTYVTSLMVAESGTGTIPSDCRQAVNQPCSSFPAPAGGKLDTVTTCTGTENCNCTVSINGTVFDTGIWSTAGNDLVLGQTGQVQTGYCVNGSQLIVGGGIIGSAVANEYHLVFTK